MTAATAFLCALLVSAGGTGTWTFQFTTLPPDDSALETWLEKLNVKERSVVRHDHSVTLQWKMGLVSCIRHDVFTIPDVPWEELGYSSLVRISGASSWSLFGGPALLWITGLGILVLFAWARRRRHSHRRASAGSAAGDEQTSARDAAPESHSR